MQHVKICSHCGQPNTADALDCIRCGHAFRVWVTVSHEPPVIAPTRHAEARKPLRYMIAGACFALALCAVFASFWLSQKPALDTVARDKFLLESPTLYANWNRVKPGMTTEGIRALVGEPSRIQGDEWYYARPQGYLLIRFRGSLAVHTEVSCPDYFTTQTPPTQSRF